MLEIFLDTANLDEIEEIKGWGIIKGVTTNQKIFCKEKGCNFKEQSLNILKMVEPFPVSLEGPNSLDELVKTAEKYNDWGSNVVIKVPMLGNGDGIRAVKILSENGIKTNVTACMTLNQTFLAASAGATYVSLFYNRMKDWKKETLKAADPVKVELECDQYAYNTIVETMEMIKKTGGKSIIREFFKSGRNEIKKIKKNHPMTYEVFGDLDFFYHRKMGEGATTIFRSELPSFSQDNDQIGPFCIKER